MLKVTFTTKDGPVCVRADDIEDFVPFPGSTEVNLKDGSCVKVLNRFYRSLRDRDGNKTVLNVRRVMRGETIQPLPTQSSLNVFQS